MTTRDSDCAPSLPAYVLLVNTERGTTRRRLYLSVSAAERAVLRAEERGYSASVVLCDVTPVSPVILRQDGGSVPT